MPPPFSALLILPAFTNSASALLGRRSGAATAVAAPACTIYRATQAWPRQAQVNRQPRGVGKNKARRGPCKQNRKRVDEKRDHTSRRPKSDIDIIGANAVAEPATASIAAAKRESIACKEQVYRKSKQILSQILLSSANRCLFGYSITANMPFKRACTALALAGSAAAFAPMMSMDMGRREVFHLPAAFLYSPVAYCDRARFSSLLCRSAAVRGSITLPPCFHSIVPWLTATRARTPFSRADCSGWRCGRRGSPAPSSERGAGGAAGLALQLSLRQVARRARDYHL